LLPIPVPPEATKDKHVEVYNYINEVILDTHDCYVASYMHDKKWWIRASAQIWNEVGIMTFCTGVIWLTKTKISDFEYAATALKVICEGAKEKYA
jgi:hypothetical protein